jgi:ABC-type branched-subunit amino acid transport system substrate-binding protein
MTERQHPIPLILGNGEDKEIFADELGTIGGVIYAVYPEVSITDRGYDMMQRYHDTYGMDASLALLHSFDAATMFIDAVEASGWIDEDGDLVIERVSLNEYIRTFDGEGAVQEISCDGTGDCGRTQFIFYTLDNGDFVEYTRS